jgi:hypothetical protein
MLKKCVGHCPGLIHILNRDSSNFPGIMCQLQAAALQKLIENASNAL